MAKEINVQQELKKTEERFQQGMKKLQEELNEQKKLVDQFVKENPYIALGIVFITGLGLGVLLTLAASGKG